MKNFKYIIGLFFLVISLTGCQEEDFTVGNLTTPSNLQIDIDIVGLNAENPNGDGSGKVNFTVSADNALSYHFVHNGDTRLAKNGSISYNFSVTGLNSYTLTVIAYGKGGNSSSKIIELDVLSSFEAPADLLEMLVGDGSRTWRIKAELGGHFGLGPVGGLVPGEWYSAGEFEKASTGMYDDRYIFDANGGFKHVTNSVNDDPNEDPSGTVFGRINLIDELGPHSETPNGADIENYPLDDYNETWALSAPDDVETLSLTGLAFMGYYTGGDHTYKIINRSSTEMLIKTTDGNSEFDWWFILTNQDPGVVDPDPFTSQFNTLFWSDEFDIDGALDNTKWTYDLGTGENGWGNGEEQSYTDDPSNVIIDGGNLKITARAGADEKYYYDDFQIVDAGGTTDTVIEDFEGTAPTFTGFGGAASQVIDNPDPSGENTSSKVGELTKGVSSEVWAGTFFEIGTALDFSANTNIIVKTWSPKVGAVVKVKIENADQSVTHEVDLNTTVANAWEELIYDFSGAPTADYVRVVIFFDFGNGNPAYTSARVKTQDLAEFTYGRVEVRAKLPAAQGTWPAIWMLGANFPDVGWPRSGEIDIMEQTGQDKNNISATLHWFDEVNSVKGDFSQITSISNATSEFHLYTLEWREDKIFVLLDGVVFYEINNVESLPFDQDFFMILNIAMGGTLGGDIDPAFTEDSMEIDYVRVYQ